MRPPINLEVAPSTVETSTYLSMPMNGIIHAVDQLGKNKHTVRENQRSMA